MARHANLTTGAIALAVLAGGLIGVSTAPSAVADSGRGGPVTQLIVRYQPGVGPQDGNGHVSGEDALGPGEQGLKPGRAIGFGYYTVQLPAPVDEASAKVVSQDLERSPKVASAEPDAIMTIDTTETPVPSWGIDRIDQRALPVDSSYSYDTTGAGVTAYIVDTGIRATHVDLAGRVRAGVDEVLDGNGTNDCNGHGTHVSGTVGGTSYGVAKGVALVPVRVLGCGGTGTASGLIAGLNWVVNDHAAGTPAVLNMSLGFGAVVSSVDTAVQQVVADGVTVVVASGNSAVSSCTSTPGDVPEAITVNATGVYGATGSAVISDSRATFSNFGSCSDIYAPGVNITSGWYTSDTATNTISGTSMAAPHVTGAAARWLQGNPSASPAQVWTALDAASTPIPASGLAGDPAKLLFSGSVAVTPSVPSAPTAVSVTPGNGSLQVVWSPPAITGGSALTYLVALFTAQTGGTQVGATCSTTALTCSFSSLTNGTTYWAQVSATNATGPGPAAPRVSGTPAVQATVPAAPTLLTAVRSGSGSVAITWTAGADGGSPITGFTARAFTTLTGTTASRTCTVAAAATTCTITGLTNGTSYFMDVVATNAVGTGPASARSGAVVPFTTPSAPRNVSVTAATKSAVVRWSAPSSTGGSAITAYTATAYTASTGGTAVSSCSATSAGRTCTIPSLTTGATYFVSVAATNAGGVGTASPRRSVTAQ